MSGIPLDVLPWDTGTDAPTNNGGPCRRKRRHPHEWCRNCVELGVASHCVVAGCGIFADDPRIRRGRANGKRGRRAELTIAREIPGARKMGPLGLPWDVEVGEYARLQVKKLVSRPSANAIRKLIEAIPNTGDRLRGFVWVEAAGQGKHGRREVTFLAAEFIQWHGADFGPGNVPLVTMPLAEWCAEFVGAEAGG